MYVKLAKRQKRTLPSAKRELRSAQTPKILAVREGLIHKIIDVGRLAGVENWQHGTPVPATS